MTGQAHTAWRYRNPADLIGRRCIALTRMDVTLDGPLDLIRLSPVHAVLKYQGLSAAAEAMWTIAAIGFRRRFLERWIALEPMRADDGRYVSASTISKGGDDGQETKAATARCRQRTLRQEELRQEPSQDDGLRDTEEALTPSRVHLTSAVVALQRHGRHSSSR